MKNFICAIVLFFATASGLHAQGKGDVEFGFFAGLNFSNVSAGYLESDHTTDFNVGASADYYFSERWSIRARAIYDKKGWDNGTYTDINDDVYIADYTLNYITIPVTANYHFGNKYNWYLTAGMYAGFLLNATESSHDTDVSDGFNSSDFGLALGLGVKIPLNDRLKLMLELDGQSGFTDIFSFEQGVNITNNRSSFNVGLAFLMK